MIEYLHFNQFSVNTDIIMYQTNYVRLHFIYISVLIIFKPEIIINCNNPLQGFYNILRALSLLP